MNKIMGASTINKNDDLPMLNVTNYLEGLGNREASEHLGKWSLLLWEGLREGSCQWV
jgi:hypothetical protein